MTFSKRNDLIFKNRLCFNCLHFGHRVAKCKLPSGSRYGGWYHENFFKNSVPIVDSSTNQDISNSGTTDTVMFIEQGSTSSVFAPTFSNVMLATASEHICDVFISLQSCKAVLDSGAHITSTFAERLKLSKLFALLPVIVSINSNSEYFVRVKTSWKIGNYYVDGDFHVLSVITNELSSQLLDISTPKMPDDLKDKLADPSFNMPGLILLGAELFFDLLNGEKIPVTNAVWNSFVLDWVLTGEAFFVSSINCNVIVLQQTAAISTPHPVAALALINCKSIQRTQEEDKAIAYFQKTTIHDSIA